MKRLLSIILSLLMVVSLVACKTTDDTVDTKDTTDSELIETTPTETEPDETETTETPPAETEPVETTPAETEPATEEVPPIVATAEETVVVTIGAPNPLMFKSEAEFDDFVRVEIDGKEVPRQYYTVVRGSTIITIDPEYLSTLGEGEHTVSIVSTTGTASANFEVEPEPVETEPAETEPTETVPAETTPVETTPVETAPVETAPVETTPVETEPVETEPVETEPVETEPAETEPVETEPAETEPAETEPPHTHEYILSNTVDKTCTKDGSKTYTCSCGDTYTDTEKATGHSYELTSSVDKTCTTDGSKTYTCSSCTDSYTNADMATGHSYTVTNSVDKTCTTNGSKTYTCSCGDTYTETERAAGHIWGDWTTVVEPTFTNNGQNRRTCSVCSESETQSIAMLVFNDTMAEEIAGAVFWANFSTHRNIYESDYSTAFTSEQAAIFVVDYLHRLHSSKVEEYAIYEDYGTWTAFLGCDIPVSVLSEYSSIVLGCTYDFASIATGDVVAVRLPVGMGGSNFEYKGFESKGDNQYVITIDLTTLGADGPYQYGTDVMTVQYHSSGIWSILSCVHTPTETEDVPVLPELTDEYVGQVFSSLESMSDEFLGSYGARIKGIYNSDYSGLSADSVARFVVFYLSSELEEYFTYSVIGEVNEGVVYPSECNMPMSLLEEYATIIFGCSYDFSSLANGDNAKIAMPYVGGRGGGDVFRKYIGFEDKGNNTLAITVNLMERDWETGNDTVLVSGILTVRYDEETGIWGVRGYEETTTPDPNVCGHKGDKSYVYVDTSYHTSRCSICGSMIENSNAEHNDWDGNLYCNLCGGICCTHEGEHRYSSNYDGTHDEVCDTCNHIIGEPQNCVDSDGDSNCDYCRYPVPCEEHPEAMCGYYDIGENTHALCCEKCYTVIYSTAEAHEDNDEDGICDVCSNIGFAVPVIPDTTVPDTTVPDTTVPDTTVPDTTVPALPELTDEYVGEVFSSLSGTNKTCAGMNADYFIGIFSGDYSELTPNYVAEFVVRYLSSELEEYCTFVDHGNWTELTECNMPMSLLDEYALIVFGRSYDFSEFSNGDNAKITLYNGGAGGGSPIARSYGGFVDMGNNTVAITANLVERDLSVLDGAETILGTGVLTVKYYEEAGIWGLVGYEETEAPDQSLCGHKAGQRCVYVDTSYHANKCDVCGGIVENSRTAHTDTDGDSFCDACSCEMVVEAPEAVEAVLPKKEEEAQTE